MRRSVQLVLLLLASSPAASGGSQPPRVEFFSPQGAVKGVRQVAARFSEPMVPLGDPRLVEPFEVECAEKGTARWADGRNWVYDFEQDLPAGIRCTFRLKPGAQTLDGRKLEAQAQFSFSTGGPAVLDSMPYEGSTVDEEQVFILGLDAPATEDSILRSVHFAVSDIAEKVGVRLLRGEERRRILENRKDLLGRYFAAVFPVGARRATVYLARAPAGGTNEERFLALRDGPDSPIVVLAAKQRFPAKAEVRLVWGKGVTSLSGVETEQNQTLPFRVREPFRARFSCERVNAQAGCIPVLPMYLSFTAPIAASDARQILLRPEGGKALRPSLPENAEFVTGVRFDGPFPEKIRFSVELPERLMDDAGRELINRSSFPLSVRTDEDPPLAKFPASFGILELNAGAALPLTVRNLEPSLFSDDAAASEKTEEPSALGRLAENLRGLVSAKPAEVSGRMLRVGNPGEILGWMGRVHEVQTERGHWEPSEQRYVVDKKPGERSVFEGSGAPTEGFTVPNPDGPKAFEVVGIPLRRPGLYVVEIASRRLGAALHAQPRPYFVQTAALVTNLSVHFKRGRESSLVWVTTLDKARPVAGARVTVADAAGKIHFEGATDAQGVARIDKPLPSPRELPVAPEPFGRVYFVSARSGEDASFVLSSWNEGIAPWRFRLPTASGYEPYLYRTVFDRALFRAGETVHMKHFARVYTGGGIELATGDLPKVAVLEHQGSEQKYELPLEWRQNGTAESRWKIPRDAKQGTYRVAILEGRSKHRTFESGSFRVESFRVPTMRAVLQPVQPSLVRAKEAQLDVQVSYLSGGAATGAAVKLRGLLQPKAVTFSDYPDFALANGNVREGFEDEEIAPWRYESYEWEEPGSGEGGPRKGTQALGIQNLTLGAAGAVRATIPDLTASESPQDLLAEVEYQDANGEWLTAATHVDLWPSAVVVGLKPDAWAVSRENLKFQALALDTTGMPMKGVPIQVDLFQRVTYSHRKRLIGGFYAYEHRTEVKRVGKACEGKADEKGLLACVTRSPVQGNVILRARAYDAANNASYANQEMWVAKSNEWWFDVGNEDRMDLIPEKKRYEPDETARLQVRMPFREATALVTVEREGVFETSVRPVSGKVPVIEVPLRGNHAPNVFVSVLAVRGRVDDVQPTALIDPGRPAFKLGVCELKVGWKIHELKVDVATDRPVYKVRETVESTVTVATASGQPLPEDAEVALAVVDEGLLDLAPNKSWDLLEAVMGQRGIEVETATAQMQVIGKRHYGRKAVSHGGGGGRAQARELFETLVYWNPAVKLDAEGKAKVSFPLNDSLTSFRIAAVASAGPGLFGTGAASIRSTQDVMVLSGLPPLVREGDAYRAGFIVRNASGRPLELSVAASVAQSEGTGTSQVTLTPLSLALSPGEARDVGWDVEVPLGTQTLRWEVAATEPGGAADTLRIEQKVIPAVPVRTVQATLLQVKNEAELAVQIPADAVPGRGGIRVQLRDRLAGDLSAVREHMGYYPYTCLEQQVSQAVVLRDAERWRRLMERLPSHLDRDGLAKYFPVMADGSDVLTAYLLAIAHEAGYEIPEAARRRMRDALLDFVRGKIVRVSALPAADLSIRKLAALEAASRYEGVDPTLLGPIAVEPNLWPTSAVLDWLNLLRRTPSIPERDGRLSEAQQIIRSRLNFQGTAMGFSTERSDYLWWLMISADANANRAILSLLDVGAWREDLPRMARGALGRQMRGHWSTTTANAWGVLAMEKFSASFEANPVSGQTSVELGGTESRRELDWPSGFKGGTIERPWPGAAGPQLLRLSHRGTGSPWATVQSTAAIPLKEPFSSGYRITRTISAVDQKAPGAWTRGDVLRVRIEVEAQSDMTWVVVNDPIPAGSSILGTGLGRDSRILTEGERRQGWVWPAFEERTFDSFRAYYEFVPKGRWAMEYTLRLNNSGRFELPETRAEALYSPEMFGETPNPAFVVNP